MFEDKDGEFFITVDRGCTDGATPEDWSQKIKLAVAMTASVGSWRVNRETLSCLVKLAENGRTAPTLTAGLLLDSWDVWEGPACRRFELSTDTVFSIALDCVAQREFDR